MALDDRFDREHLKALDDLDDMTVADGEPDPRGWDVRAGGSKIGEVDDLIVDTGSMKVRYLDVDLDEDAVGGARDEAGNHHVTVPVDEVRLDSENKQVLLNSASVSDLSSERYAAFDRPGYGGESTPASEYDARGSAREGREGRLTRAEEELELSKQKVERGEVVVGKHVETEHVEQPITRRHEEVEIERRPVTGDRAYGDAAIGASSDEVRIPLMEEEVQVEKRPVVKEELVVNKRTVEERDKVEADLRKEEFDVDRRGAAKDRFRDRE